MTGSVQRISAIAARAAADGPARLERFAAASEDLTLEALADLLVSEARSASHPDALLEHVVGTLVTSNVPGLSEGAVRGMMALARAEQQVADGRQQILEELRRELAAGRRLADTSLWNAEQWTSNQRWVVDHCVTAVGIERLQGITFDE